MEFEEIFLLPMESVVERERENVEVHSWSGTVSYPYTLDWREKGFVSPVSSKMHNLFR